MKPQKLLVVVGPTASGKTALAVQMAEALGGEIVTADSVQVYRHFDCGTGKPTADEKCRAVHHLVDILDPLEQLDAAGWAERAEQVVAEVAARHQVPIVCGGSFLWVRALLFGLAEAPGASPDVRARHRALVEAQGRTALYNELAARDPAIAARLNPNDFVRVSRALEVLEITGVPMSQWQAEHGFRTQRYAFELLGVKRERPELDERIAARVDKMFESGWLDEVQALVTRGYGAARAMGSVGYRQVHEALQARTFELAELQASIVRATRVFARRQRTWLRDQPVRWVAEGDAAELTQELLKRKHEFLPEST